MMARYVLMMVVMFVLLPSLQACKKTVRPSAACQGPVVSRGQLEQAPVIEKHIAPNYPKEEALVGLAGVVQLKFVINADGTVCDVALVETSGWVSFDDAAMEAVEHWTYVPGQIDGAAVRSEGEATIEFKVEVN